MASTFFSPRDERRQRLLISLGAAAPELSSVADIVARVLGDMTATVGDQAGLWGEVVPLVLKRALPRDTANPFKPALMRELLEPLELPAHEEERAGPLYLRVWNSIRAAFESAPQATPIALVTGVSGAGKTKVAYDIGLRCAFSIVSRVCEHDAPTAPWHVFFEFARELIVTAPAMPAPLAPAPALFLSPALSLCERTTLVSVLIVLQAAHLRFAVSVAQAAIEDVNFRRAVDHTRGGFPELSESAVRRRVLREVVLRAQRNRLAYLHVRQEFVATMRGSLLDDDVIREDATCELTSDRALKMLQANLLHAGAVWGSDSPIVWCHDEVQALFTVDGIPADIFRGVYLFRDATATTTTPESNRYNCFYGLLAAIRSAVSVVGCAHVLLGNNVNLTTDLLAKDSPAQGVSKLHDATFNLDPPAMRAWLGALLTDAAMAGVTDDLLERLRGRPLFISSFWQELVAEMAATRDAKTPSTPSTASELVAAALASARTQAFKDARFRIAALWDRTANTSHGLAPSALASRLFHAAIMDGGAGSVEMFDGMHVDVRCAIERGILNVRSDSITLSLAHEPITTDALRAVGEHRTMSTGKAEDAVMRQLAEPTTDLFGGSRGARNPVAEDCFSWALVAHSMRLHRAAGAIVSLQTLLQPFMSAMDADRLPAEFATLGVRLTHGINCAAALGDTSATACFLTLLDAYPTALLHHTQEAAGGADLAFMTWRIEAAATPGRLVILHVKTRSPGSLQAALRSLDFGTWYTDQIVKPAMTTTETRSHVAMRELLTRRPEFATPIRVIVAGRAFSPKTHLLVAWLNSKELQDCPIVLATLSAEGLGVDFRPSDAGMVYDPPADYRAWWPTPVRHWSAPPAYPALPPLPAVGPPAVSLCVVLMSTALLTSVSKDELVALAGSFGELTGVPRRNRTIRSSVTVTFATLAGATAAVQGLHAIRGMAVKAAFA